MKCICRIMDVEMGTYAQGGKTRADLSIKSGESLISLTIWQNGIDEKLHEKAQKLVGQETLLDVNVEMYRGNVSYSLGFNNEFLPYVAAPARPIPQNKQVQ